MRTCANHFSSPALASLSTVGDYWVGFNIPFPKMILQVFQSPDSHFPFLIHQQVILVVKPAGQPDETLNCTLSTQRRHLSSAPTEPRFNNA